MRIHTTKDGAKIKLCDMTDSHLAATIRMMERKASEGITVRMGGGSCPDDFWYDENRIEGKTALEHMGYVDYVKERDRRISKRRGCASAERRRHQPLVGAETNSMRLRRLRAADSSPCAGWAWPILPAHNQRAGRKCR